MSVAVEAADDLGQFLLQWALAWDWGAWPEGSPEFSDPDLGESRRRKRGRGKGEGEGVGGERERERGV